MNKLHPCTTAEIEQFLHEYPEWNFKNDALQTSYTCETFEEAISQINRVAGICSELDHHPTIENTYNKLSFTLTTHDAGNKVTGVDVAVAKRITAVLNEAN